MWKKVQNHKKNKIDKIPLGSSTDPETWTSFENAFLRISQNPTLNLGVVLTTKTTDEYILLCCDFDYSVGSQYEEEILKLKEDAWIERSVSNKGYHAFFCVKKSEFENFKFKTRYKNEELGRFELYYTDRFFALTGNHVQGSFFNAEVLSRSAIESLLEIDLVEQDVVKSPIISDFNFEQTHTNAEILKAGVYLEDTDSSKRVFAWVASVIGLCANVEQLLEVFYSTPLAVGIYARESKDKLRRVLPYILQRLDLQELRLKQNKPLGFDIVSDVTIKKLVDAEISAKEEYRSRYAKLLHKVFNCENAVKKDIFDGDAYFYRNKKLVNIESEEVIRTLKDEVRVFNNFETNRDLKYRASEVHDAITAYKMTLKEELLIDIEPWDGEDRIKFLSTLVNFEDTRINSDVFEYFLKDWAVKSIHKVMTGTGDNRMIVLQGGQGVGKDSFLGMLYGGWTSKYSREISAPARNDGEKVLLEQIFDVAVASLAELDKFNIQELKRIIDNDTFNFRPSYGKRVIGYRNRTSFVASCNPKNVLQDETGNRRFLLFSIFGRADTEESKITYPLLPVGIKRAFNDQDVHFKNQVLAQKFAMWVANGKKPLEKNVHFESLMQKIQNEATPEDSSLEIVAEFDNFIKKMEEKRISYGDNRKLFTREDLGDDLKRFADRNEMKINQILALVAKAGDRKAKDTNLNFNNGKTFYFQAGNYTLEERQKYKDFEGKNRNESW